MSLNSILLIGRKNCKYSNSLYSFLKKKIRQVSFIQSGRIGEKLNLKESIKFKKKKIDLIISFRSFYLLRDKDLSLTNLGAINFHAGTPEFRGIGSLNFAIYKRYPYFGSTCHMIDLKIDNGPILDVMKFKLNYKKIDLDAIISKTHYLTLLQAKKIILDIKKNPKNIKKMIVENKKIRWSKKISKLKDLRNLYIVKKNISKSGLLNKIRATNSKDFKPYILLHGKKFEYVQD